MWNPFNYLLSGSNVANFSNSAPTSSKQIDIEIQKQFVVEQNNIKIKDKYLIEEYQNYHKKIKDFQILIMRKPHSEQLNERNIKMFSQLIQSLQKFLNMLGNIRIQYQQNLSKIQNYDHVQKKLQNHSFIVQNILKDHQNQIQALLQKYRQRQSIYETNLLAVHKQLESKADEYQSLQKQIQQVRQKNQILEEQNKQLSENLQKTEYQANVIKQKLGFLMNQKFSSPLDNNKLSSPKNNLYNAYSYINLQSILISQKKYLPDIISFLTLPEMLSLSLTNKKVNYLISKQLPFLTYKYMSKNYKKQLKIIQNQSIYYNNLLFQQFQNQNVKINAIKYLFFKNKPGSYILSMFQEDITKLEDQNYLTLPSAQSTTSQNSEQQNQKDQSRKSWKDYFKSQKNKKQQPKLNTVNRSSSITQKFSLADLKSSQSFQKIQQQLSKAFHQHFFSLKLPKDLQTFGKIMEEQFLELKKQLSDLNSNNKSQLTIKQWTSKLLTLSKFLYLESQQMWGLCQSIFTKLIDFEKKNLGLKSQLQDLSENHHGLRKLVQQLAKSKIQMQKRIWQSQRKSGFLKSSSQNVQKVNEKLQTQCVNLRETLQKEQTKSYELQKQLNQCKQKLCNVSRKYKQKMAEFTQLKDQISKLSWL